MHVLIALALGSTIWGSTMGATPIGSPPIASTPIWGLALSPPIAATAAVPLELAHLRTIGRAEPDETVPAVAYDTTMMEWTRAMSLASVVGFAGAAVLGAIQFADEYGFHDERAETACATGDNVLDDCGGATPWPHLLAVGATAGLGLTTLILSTQVDYEQAARRDGDWRTYEVTRWIGLGMFVVQAAGGFLLANSIRWGWADEQRDFETLQALAGAHLGWGAATMGLEIYNTAILF